MVGNSNESSLGLKRSQRLLKLKNKRGVDKPYDRVATARGEKFKSKPARMVPGHNSAHERPLDDFQKHIINHYNSKKKKKKLTEMFNSIRNTNIGKTMIATKRLRSMKKMGELGKNAMAHGELARHIHNLSADRINKRREATGLSSFTGAPLRLPMKKWGAAVSKKKRDSITSRGSLGEAFQNRIVNLLTEGSLSYKRSEQGS